MPALPAAAPVAPAMPLVFTERAGLPEGRTVVEAGTIGAAFTFSSAGVSLAAPAGTALQLTFPGANPHTTVRAVVRLHKTREQNRWAGRFSKV